jgi:hypothetical protein
MTYGHALTYQISLTYLERQKCYGPDKKILFKKTLFDLQVAFVVHPSVICKLFTFQSSPLKLLGQFEPNFDA